MPPGRPKKSDIILTLELRITPPDQEPITDWHVDENVTKLLACQEGGIGTTKQLHYHCYIETPRTRNWLLQWIYTITRCRHTGHKGNQVFFSRKPHDHTMGYIVKEGNVVVRHGIDQTLITDYIQQSKQYAQEKERERKKDQRTRKTQVDEIMENVKKHLEETPGDRTVAGIAWMILDEFRLRNLLLPNRSNLEQMTLTLLYTYNPEHVRHVYTKFISE